MWLGLPAILLINLLGDSGSKTQMVFPRGTVSAMILVSPLVTLCSWSSLSPPRLCSFAVSGLVYPRLFAQTCFSKCPLSGSVPTEDPGLGLVPQKFLTLVYSLGVPNLGCTQSHRRPDLGLLPQGSQTHSWTHRDLCFLPTPLEVQNSLQDPQKS